mmetsp:Transcript_18641/g.58264  ORF Transcript_18641/g.58264 Transcript_18641/m.58264 type:complete len:306 (+) Transcript_18641:178-1095(+)
MAALLADHYDDSELEAGVIPNPLAQPLVGSRRTRSPSTSSFLAATFSSAQKRVCQETGAVVIEQGDQVFQLPPLLDEAACRGAVLEVDGRVTLGLATTRGAALPSIDVYVRDLRCASRLHAAIDAGLHLVERCTGRLVDCKKEEVFVITYCATGQRGLGRHVRRPERKPNPSVLTLLCPSRGRRQQSNAAKFSFIELRLSEQRGPREHADAAKTIRNGLSLSEVGLQVDGDQKQTLLVTLDAPEDYAGGGTRFFPAADASGVARPFVARTRADHVRLATVFSDDVARIIGNGTSSRRRGGDVDSP